MTGQYREQEDAYLYVGEPVGNPRQIACTALLGFTFSLKNWALLIKQGMTLARMCKPFYR